MARIRMIAWGAGALLLALVIAYLSMVRIHFERKERAQAATLANVPAAQPRPEAPQPLPAGSLAIPVAGVTQAQLVDTWGQTRAAGSRWHQAIDIMAPGGTPVLAAAPGRVEKLYFSKGGGGISLYQRSIDGRWSYYYAHLQGYADGVREGVAVRTGDLLGYVGDTGNAGAGNTHLHFAVAQMQAGERWWQGTPVNPYPLLAGRDPHR